MEYLIFSGDELEDVLSGIKDAKPAFKRYKYVEILAQFDGGVVGKYGDIVFMFSEREPPIEEEPLERFVVEISEDDGSYKPFRFGKYRYEGKLLIDVEFSEDLFYDYLPALLSEMARAKTLINECNIRAGHLADRETKIVREVIKLSEEAKTLDAKRLEELSFELSSMRAEFFSGYMNFKDILEGIFSAILRAERISSFLGDMLEEELKEMKTELERMKHYESSFEETLTGVRDALNVVHLRLEMLRGKENLELQKRTSALQAAAAIIEFVAVYYYTMKIWENFLPVEKTPSAVSFSLLFAFTTIVVILTEAIGEYIKDKKVTTRLALLSILLLITLALMIYLPILFSKA
ncbi:hypothetical protein [Archaeoglobus sp.]